MQHKLTRTLFAAVLLVTLGLAGCATGDSPSSTTETSARSTGVGAAFGVRKPKHVGVALMSAREMLSGEAEQSADRVAIVACGPAIRALATDSKFEERIRAGLRRGVQIKACGVTVRRMEFDTSTFIEGVEVVPNGFVELIRLQEKGYHSVEL